MSDALQGLAPPTDPDLLVGYDTSDDASVYKVSPDTAMISTVDFITPPVDDPWWFGQIAAANAISDVYSMGGRPLTALNLVMFPSKMLDMGILKEILRGGHEKALEAGVVLAGGHSVDDEEPKYGLCVNGVVHPDRVITNMGARAGDALILTKPLGSGVLFNAVRSGKLAFDRVTTDVLPMIAALNGPAMEAALAYDLHACTDVTGFGILGHLMEMSQGCGKKIRVIRENLPIYPHAREMYAKGETTGSNKANRAMVNSHDCDIPAGLAWPDEELLYDPQTSGGLILAVPGDRADALAADLKQAGVAAHAVIGEVLDDPAGIVVV